MRGLQLLAAWSGLFFIPSFLGYSQFRKFITKQFVEALPEPLQEPSREVQRLLESYPSLYIDKPQRWNNGHLNQSNLLANQLEKFLDELANHVHILSEGVVFPWTRDFHSLPVVFKGIHYLFQASWEIVEQKVHTHYGPEPFFVTGNTVNEWWGVRVAHGRFWMLRQRFFMMVSYQNDIKHPLVVATFQAKESFWKVVSEIQTLHSVLLMEGRNKLLAIIDAMPIEQFNLVEQDMLNAIRHLAPSLTEFRESLSRSVSIASKQLNRRGLSCESAQSNRWFIRDFYKNIGRGHLMEPLGTRKRAFSSQVGFASDNLSERQARFVTLMTRLHLLYWREAMKMLALTAEYLVQSTREIQEQTFLNERRLLNEPSFNEEVFKEAYAGATKSCKHIMWNLKQDFSGDHHSLLTRTESFRSFRTLESQMMYALGHAMLHLDLYNLSREPEPEARRLLASIHGIAVGMLRQLDNLFRAALSKGEEYKCNEWLLWLLVGVDITWCKIIEAMRVLVPGLEEKLRIPHEGTYKWEESPLYLHLICISNE